MKNINKFLFIAVAAAGLTLASCQTNDTIGEKVDNGQAVPTCYWEVGSTVAKAGSSYTFQGKYNVEPGKQVAYSQVWYRVMRDESAAATVALAGTSLSYTKTYSGTDTMRAFEPIVTYKHTEAKWDGYEFIITGEVPVSRTLAPVQWTDATVFDQDRYNQYYPAGFDKEFCADVVNYLTKDSTYYNALRNVYINYPFTNEQFAAVNTKYGVDFPTDIDTTDKAASDKSDRWFSTTEASDAAIVGYYYTTVENGKTIVHEVAKDATQTEGINYYPVYKSAAWVFCRYNDDLGAIISTVRAQYMPAFIELLNTISFSEWIFDSANKVYKVDFSRKYSLQSQFRVYDTDGEEGIAADTRVISIN